MSKSQGESGKHENILADVIRSLNHARELLAISGTDDIHDVGMRILYSLHDIVPFVEGTLQLIDGDNRHILAATKLDPNEVDLFLLRPISEDPLIGQIFATRRTMVLKDYEFPHFGITSNMRSWIGIPLIYGDKAIGLITLSNAHRDPYTEEQITLLELMAQYATSIIHDAISFQEKQEQVVALKEAKEVLESALAFFESYRNLALIGLVYGEDIHYAKNRLGLANSRARRIAEGYITDSNVIKEHAQLIGNSIEQYLELLDLIQTMALESPEHNVLNIHEMLDGILKSKLIGSHIAILKNYEATVPTVFAPRQLRQVFLVIIQNALDAMDKGEGTLGIRTETKEHAGQHFILVSISDTGKGIPKHQQANLFTLRGFAPQKRGRRSKGSGIGLPWASAFMRVYRGQIEFTTTSERGTTMHVHVPQDFRRVLPLPLHPEEISDTLSRLGRVTEPHIPIE